VSASGKRLGARWLGERLAASYWTAPLVMVIASVGLAFATSAADNAVRLQSFVALWGSDLDAGLVLSTVAGSMITVAALVFSITMVVLTMTAQQFGHRLVRGVLSDRTSQIVLGFFLSTFVYCLLSLALLHRVENGPGFVPAVTTGVAVLLGIGGVVFLIQYVNHVMTKIRIDNILKSIEDDFAATVEAVYGLRGDDVISEDDPVDWDGGPPSRVVSGDSGGYVQLVRMDPLEEIVDSDRVRVDLHIRPGDFVYAGQALARVDAPGAEEKIERAVNKAIVVGTERTPAQDVRLGLYQLQEAALRALSPGINDPHTAVSAVARMRGCLLMVAGRDEPRVERRDEQGKLRLRVARVSFDELVTMAIGPLIVDASASADVLMEIVETVSALEEKVEDEAERETLKGLVESVRELSDDVRPSADAARVRGACLRLLGRLTPG
jgi:uncharacterized membrane protein